MSSRGSHASRQHPIWASTWGLVRALHPFPSFLVSGIVLALIPLADRAAAPEIYARLGLGMLCYQFAIGLTNDIVDARADAVAKPYKPLAAGILGRGWATGTALVTVCGGIAITYPLPAIAWAIGLGGLACGLVYDLWLKGSWWSWLPFVVALPLVPLWVWTATDRWDGFLAWVAPLGALLGISVHLANQAPDIAADRALGVGGMAQRIGEGSRSLAIGLFAATVAAATMILATRSIVGAGAVAGIGALTTALAPLSPRLLGHDGLFGLLAVGSGGLAIVFLAAA